MTMVVIAQGHCRDCCILPLTLSQQDGVSLDIHEAGRTFPLEMLSELHGPAWVAIETNLDKHMRGEEGYEGPTCPRWG